jgi:hypothetical protein
MNFETAVVVSTFSDKATAAAAVSLLQSEGIEAAIASDDAGGEIPSLDLARGVRVLVQEEHAEFAKALLEQGADSSDE